MSKEQPMIRLFAFLRKEYLNGEYNIFPKADNIFNAFEFTPYSEVKVVVLGQDPYHDYVRTKEGKWLPKATGLAFSMPAESQAPSPSLRNIMKEFGTEKCDLSSWAKQGVLLLNTILTVREKTPGSHVKQGWEFFIREVFRELSEKENVVYMLWGNYAKSYAKYINPKRNLILTSSHPSPLSANRGGWFGNQHNKKCNDYLTTTKKSPIVWV